MLRLINFYHKNDKIYIQDYPYVKNDNYNEYEKAIRFLETGCSCGCSKMIPKEKFAELREVSRSEQDIFLMAQLKAMSGGEITASRRLKRKRVLIKELFIIEIAIRRSVRKRISIC